MIILPQFLNEEVEGQRDELVFWKSHSCVELGIKFELRSRLTHNLFFYNKLKFYSCGNKNSRSKLHSTVTDVELMLLTFFMSYSVTGIPPLEIYLSSPELLFLRSYQLIVV